MGRRLGLIIGVNTYQDSTFQSLQYAENDARAFAQWLVNVKGGAWSPGDVQLVQGSHATKELMESLIAQMCLTLAEPDDVVLLYFAGHAFLDERNGDGYLALSNTQYNNPPTGLHLLSFANQVMARCRAAHVLVMLDCFQTGSAWQMRRASPYDVRPLIGPTLLNILQQQGNRIFLCSCRGNAGAPESGERGLGLFMHRTIVGLSGPAREPSTELVTLQSLYGYLVSILGEQQSPKRFGQESHTFDPGWQRTNTSTSTRTGISCSIQQSFRSTRSTTQYQRPLQTTCHSNHVSTSVFSCNLYSRTGSINISGGAKPGPVSVEPGATAATGTTIYASTQYY